MTGATVEFARPLGNRESERFDGTDWLQLVRSEYLEMPGLCLTKRQVRRLWSLDDANCESLLTALIDQNFLRRTADGAYVLAGDDIG